MTKKQAEQQTLFGRFTDAAIYSADNKTAVSVRDGVIEYMGAELGIKPSEKLFKVYRSPTTIANAALKMQGIPLTDEHVEVGVDVADSAGQITSAIMVDLLDSDTSSTVAVQNSIEVSDAAVEALNSGKRELSLGYNAKLIKSDAPEYDFIQQNIEPHHLAIVDQGRCGSSCSFIDKKPLTKKEPTMAKKELIAAISAAFTDKKSADALVLVFTDADGKLRVDELLQFVKSLPEMMKDCDIEKVKQVMAVMKEAKEEISETLEEDGDPSSSEDPGSSEQAAADSDEEKEKIPMKDSKEFQDTLKKMTDTAIAEHSGVMQRAREFVDAAYDFKGKTAPQIMRDCLATQYGSQAFSDSELSTAFKMMRPAQKLEVNLSDQKANDFNSLADQEI